MASEEKSKQSTDEDDEFVIIRYPSELLPARIFSSSDQYAIAKSRDRPLNEQEFQSYLDPDGRLVNEHSFRQAVFKRGIDPSIRRTVWLFLFKVFPFHSTKRERDILLADHHVKYKMMKEHWKGLLSVNKSDVLTPNYCESNVESNSAECFNLKMKEILGMDEHDANDQLNWMHVDAKVNMSRKEDDVTSLIKYIRLIDKDVPRTDKHLDYFKGADNPNMLVLRDILITFAHFHSELGYSQGMNDHLSRFLITLDSEAEAYWCFTSFIEEFQKDFTADGMMHKIELLEDLLKVTDPDLYEYIKSSDIGNLTFCHRWLLLMFKRDFDADDGLKIFEIISSHHIEMSSVEAKRAKEMARLKELDKDEACKPMVDDTAHDSELTFDLFICLTLLIDNREKIFACCDCMDIIMCGNTMTQTTNLDDLLSKSELIFYNYCQLSVVDSFQLLQT
ncbi:Uncharacterised protein g2863 [Pycnogonum litorale]